MLVCLRSRQQAQFIFKLFMTRMMMQTIMLHVQTW